MQGFPTTLKHSQANLLDVSIISTQIKARILMLCHYSIKIKTFFLKANKQKNPHHLGWGENELKVA